MPKTNKYQFVFFIIAIAFLFSILMNLITPGSVLAQQVNNNNIEEVLLNDISPLDTTPTPSPTKQEVKNVNNSEIVQAVLNATNSYSLGGKYSPEIGELIVDSDWALAIVYLQSSLQIMNESNFGNPIYVLVHREDSIWHAESEGSSKFVDWTVLAPESVVHPSLREFLLDRFSLSTGDVHTLSVPNLKLPWYPGNNPRFISGYLYDEETHKNADKYAQDWSLVNVDVAAVAGGTVIDRVCDLPNVRDDLKGYGNYVLMDIGNGVYARYAHLQSCNMSMNQAYPQGYKVGVSGTSGKSTGPHLHFQLKDSANNPVLPQPISGYNSISKGVNYYSDNSSSIITCPAPTNGNPRDNKVLNNNHVTFTWTPSNCLGLDYYTFRVSTSSDMNNSSYWIKDHGVSSNASSQEEDIPTQYNGQTLYWAIWPHNGAGYGPIGGPWAFKIDTSSPTPPPPIPTGNWNVQYFRNKEFGDQCNSATINDTFIFKDWGDGIPMSSCNSDNWSARFSRRVYFQGGNYSFAVEADDWGRIYVDNVLFVDKWNGASQHYEGHYVSTGDHDVRIEFADTLGSAKISAWWWGPGFNIPHDIQDPYQWFANYWINPTQWWDAYAKVNEGSGNLSHNWGSGSPGWDIPADNFSASFLRTAYFNCGQYQFTIDHDDGAKVSIDGNLVVDRWTGSIGSYSFYQNMSQGDHTLKVDYYENGGSAHIFFNWDQTASCAPPTPVLVSPANGSTFAWNTDFTLEWSPSSNATQYFATLQGGPGVDINSGWITGTQWYIGGLWPGVYTWSVTARNDSGSSPVSSSRTFMVEDMPAPIDDVSPVVNWVAPVGNTQTYDVTGQQVTLTVSATDNVGVSYVHFARWDYVNLKMIDIEDDYSAPYSIVFDSSVLDPQWNEIQAWAYDEAGNSDYQYIWLNKIDLAAPTNVSASDGTYTDKVQVSWSGSSGATYYEVYRNTSNTSSGSSLLGSPGGTPYDDTGAVAGTTYYYFVKACNGAGCSGYSTGDSGYVMSGNVPAPVSPSGKTYTKLPSYEWTPYNGATKYKIQVYSGTTRVFSQTTSNSVCNSTLCQFKPTFSIKFTEYKWRVRAYVGGAWGTWSDFQYFSVSKEFDSQFTSDTGGWSVVSGFWTLSAGEYYGTNGIARKTSSIIHTANYSTLTYSVRVKRTTTDTTKANQVIIRGVPNPLNLKNRWYSGYVFQWSDNRNFTVYKILNGNTTTLKPWTSYNGIYSQDWNTIKVTAKGSSLAFYINDSLVWSGTDSSLTTGKVGIGMKRGSTESTVFLVDWAQLVTDVSTSADITLTEVGEEHTDWTSIEYAGPPGD